MLMRNLQPKVPLSGKWRRDYLSSSPLSYPPRAVLSRENRTFGVIFLQEIAHGVLHLPEAVDEPGVREHDLRLGVLLAQKAAAAALRGPQHDMEVMVEEFKRRKDYVVKRLNGIPGIVCPDVKGAFYVYPDVQAYLGKSFGDRKIETAVDLCQYLLDEALVSTVPGEAYNVPGKIRISYSNSMENLEKALDRVEKALEDLH